MEKQSAKSVLSALAEEYEYPALLDKSGYFNNWKNNVFGKYMPSCFYKMFAKGNGNELKGKARAIHSSSMLAYNFFHWVSEGTPLELFGKKFVDVAFEVKLPCLKKGMANLDVALVGEDGESVLFLESKFTEHFHNRTFSMSGSYKNPAYYENNSSWPSVVESVETLVKERNYNEGIKQCVCHLIAIDRLRRKDQKSKETLSRYFTSLNEGWQFYFATIVFEPNGKRFKKDHDAFERYLTLFRQFVEKVPKDTLFRNPDDKLNPPGFLTYGDVWTKSKGAMPNPLREYLGEKYMKLSATPEP